jgi:hypothetical protein
LRAVEDGGEVGGPVLAEQQVVVHELRQASRHAEHDQHRADAGVALGEVLLRVGPQLCRQEPGLGVVEVRAGDDDVGTQLLELPLGGAHAQPGRPLIDGRNRRDLRVHQELHPLFQSQSVEGLDDGGETADRVPHALHQVGVAHEVVEGRSGLGA